MIEGADHQPPKCKGGGAEDQSPPLGKSRGQAESLTALQYLSLPHFEGNICNLRKAGDEELHVQLG